MTTVDTHVERFNSRLQLHDTSADFAVTLVLCPYEEPNCIVVVVWRAVVFYEKSDSVIEIQAEACGDHSQLLTLAGVLRDHARDSRVKRAFPAERRRSSARHGDGALAGALDDRDSAAKWVRGARVGRVRRWGLPIRAGGQAIRSMSLCNFTRRLVGDVF